MGRLLSENELHLRTLSALAVQLRYLTHFAFFTISLLGKTEAPNLNDKNDDDARLLLRLFTPVLKATVAKMGVAFVSECMECLGGQGYVEEGGIAVIYRDIQVNSIWEGTTNVLAHDMLRVLRGRFGVATIEALDRYIANSITECEKCRKLGDLPQRTKEDYEKWRGKALSKTEGVVELHARDLALWLGRTIGAVEMLRDAATDGDDVEIECCKRVFDVKNHEWDENARNTAEWDRRIVFGQDKSDLSTVVQARL
jgi:putative acyl-CoA dehydrogenase